ncbi:TIR domain-containing protein [Burkholderia cenocepacia]|uniref:TIR domain-containing protein n=1 Tax=Burkholderia cenocepacia TaxID=95486 RepID=UPI00265516FF|nr:TIR domain-containing protein [Burkholderia cenocepacia]MDN7631635.1 TIR domain-containing protein [Burkholderia cenocepacia]
MTKAFYSFHFDNDVSRVAQVRNMGALTGDQLVDDNSWEQVKRGGENGIKDWIARQMSACDVVIVMVGAQTASRHWVDYEIRRGWDTKKPIFGIRIDGLKDLGGRTSTAGKNPFEQVPLQSGKILSQYVPLHNPAGLTSQDVYASIQKNIKSWIANAPSLK